MITLPIFQDIDQSKPIQILLDNSGMVGCCFEWYDCELAPDKDNAVLFEGRIIDLNAAQSLRNRPE